MLKALPETLANSGETRTARKIDPFGNFGPNILFLRKHPRINYHTENGRLYTQPYLIGPFTDFGPNPMPARL